MTQVALVTMLACFVITVGCARSPGLGGSAGDPASGGVHSPRLGQADPLTDDDETADDYDPWQPFNEKMFAFNHDILDRYLMKPAASGWEKICPAPVRRSFARMFDNLDMPRRFVNNLLQARPVGAGRELARFAVNTTVGVVGLFDVATPLHIDESNADAGETLALYGFSTGPYLVLPTMAPSTVRDAIGKGIDGLFDPVSYFLPFIANRAKSLVTAINDRSLNLTLYANVEDSVLDLYSAARNGYLQRRRRAIELAAQSRRQEWMWAQASPEPAETLRAETAATSSGLENPS